MGDRRTLVWCAFVVLIGSGTPVSAARRTVEVTPQGIRLDGQPRILLSGSVEFTNLPPEQWASRLARLRAAGFHAVSTSVPWNLHMPTADTTTLVTGDSDLESFLDEVSGAGLLAIVRVGPAIGGGADLGGLPAWLEQAGVPPEEWRTASRLFLAFVDRWFKELLPILAERQYTRGGPVLAIQLEQDYDYDQQPGNAWAREYVAALYRLAQGYGIEVPVVRSPGTAVHQTQAGVILGPRLAVQASLDDWERSLADSVVRQPTYPLVVPVCEASVRQREGERTEPVLDRSLGLRTRLALMRGAAWIDWQTFAAGICPPLLSGAGLSSVEGAGAPIDPAGRPGPGYQEGRRCTGWLAELEADLHRARPSAWCLAEDERVRVYARSALAGARFACLALPETVGEPVSFNLRVPATEEEPERLVTIGLPPGASRLLVDRVPIDSHVSLGLCSAELFAVQHGDPTRIVLWDYPGVRGVVTLAGPRLELVTRLPSTDLTVERSANGISFHYVDLQREHIVALSGPAGRYVLILVPREETAAWWKVAGPEGDYLLKGPTYVRRVWTVPGDAVYADVDHPPGPVRISVYPPFRPHGEAAVVLNDGRFPPQRPDTAGGVHVDLTVRPVQVPENALAFSVHEAFPERAPEYDDGDWTPIGAQLLPFERVGNTAERFGWYRATFDWNGTDDVVLKLWYHKRALVHVNGRTVHRGSRGAWEGSLSRFLDSSRPNVVAILVGHEGRSETVVPRVQSGASEGPRVTGAIGTLSTPVTWRFRAGLSGPGPLAAMARPDQRPEVRTLALVDWHVEHTSEFPDSPATREPGAAAGVANPDYDDANWRRIELGVPLGQWFLRDDETLDLGWKGYGWFRTRFRLPEGWPSVGIASLDLGRFGGQDRTFVNGELVGSAEGDVRRIYEVDLPQLYRDRANVIAVQLRHAGREEFLVGEGRPTISAVEVHHDALWYRSQLSLRDLGRDFLRGVYDVSWGLTIEPGNAGFVRCNERHAGSFGAGERVTIPLLNIRTRSMNTIDIFEQAIDQPAGQALRSAELVPIYTLWHSPPPPDEEERIR